MFQKRREWPFQWLCLERFLSPFCWMRLSSSFLTSTGDNSYSITVDRECVMVILGFTMALQ